MAINAKILFTFFTLFSVVSAYCPNGCSGHGSCGINGELIFYEKYLSVRE